MVVADGGEQVGHVVVVQLVSDVAAVAASVDQAQRAEEAEVMRGCAQAQSRGGGEVLHAALAAQHPGQQAQPARGAERFERLREILCVALIEATVRGRVFDGMRHGLIVIRHMSKCSTVVSRALLLAVSASLVLPAAGFAHALFGDSDPNRPIASYLRLGFLHMVGGWDHLLFITGVVLIAGRLRSAAKLISLFVAGHSLTLLVATLAGWKLNATVVDVVIALSLVYVGVQGIRGRPESLSVMGAAVFGFGLVHGLGLSTRLQALGLPDDGLVIRVVLFNIGVELGQLVALSVIVGLGTLFVRRFRLQRRDARLAYGSLIAAGVFAAAVLSFPSEEARKASQPVARKGSATCTEDSATPPQTFGGGHPEKLYYGPEEDAPDGDLNHVLGDGLVIVRYRPDLADEHHRALERFVAESVPPYVIAAADPEQEESIRAVVALREMSCERVDIKQLTTFRDEWLAELDQRRGG